MINHMTIRLPFMDHPNNGRICNKPKLNHYCCGSNAVGGGLVKRYKSERIADEEAHASKLISKAYIPPCSAYSNVFGEHSIPHIHLPPKWMIDKIGPFPETTIPPYSGFTWPYEEVTSSDPDSESAWASPEEREKKVKEFFSQFVLGSSFCVFYYNFDNPINGLGSDPDQNRYVVAGFSRLKSIGDPSSGVSISRWNNMDPITERNVGNQIWAIPYSHSFNDHGFLMPIHEVLALADGVKKAQEVALFVSPSMTPPFKYVCNTLSDDQMIFLLEEALFRINYAAEQGYISEDDALKRMERAESFLREAKTNRSDYPGVGAVFEHLGVSRGRELHRVHLTKLAQTGTDLKDWFLRGIASGAFESIQGVTAPKSAISRFKALPQDIQTFLVETAFRLDISASQISEITESNERWRWGFTSSVSAITANPYLLSEEYQPGSPNEGDLNPPIPVFAIDNVCLRNVSESDFEDPATSRERIRAIAIDELKVAQSEGHTFLQKPELVKRINIRLRKDKQTIRSEYFDADIAFHSERLKIFGDRVYLNEMFEDERYIESRLTALMEREQIEFGRKVQWEHPRKREELSQERYDRAIRTQEVACNKILQSRISVITGSAGTGKTEIAKTFKSTLIRMAVAENRVSEFSFTGAAFTGKAANNLNRRISGSFTIHRLLSDHAIVSDTGNFLVKREPTSRLRTKNLIIDECSMLEVGLLASFFRIIDWNYLDRIILIGDPFQLPPIGPGRPFYDIIQALKVLGTSVDSGNLDSNEYITSLKETVRLNKDESSLLEFGGVFAGGSRSSVSRVLNDISKRGDQGDLEIVSWDTPDSLRSQLLDHFSKTIHCNKPPRRSNFEAFKEFVDDGARIDRIQITSPYNVDHFGTEELNAVIQSFLNEGKRRKKITTSSNSFFEGDKVIQVRNSYGRPRDFNDFKKGKVDIYNGYQGILRKPASIRNRQGAPAFINVSPIIFEGDEKISSIYRVAHLNAEVKPGFCISVHKAQGSEFSVNYFILPKVAKNMPRELIYTGLTRGVDLTVLFVERSDEEPLERIFIELSSLSNSAIDGRNTSLFEDLPAPENEFRPEGKKHSFVGGRRFRSKSEMLVYTLLCDLGRKFGWRIEYEQVLEVDGKIRAPDFKVITPNKTYWVEHIGLYESSPQYRRDWDEKEAWYRLHGILDQLIITTEGAGIDLGKIERQILDKIQR